MSGQDNSTTITAYTKRDNGKTFKIKEVPPVDMATFILRLLAAIRLGGVDELLAMIRPKAPIDPDARTAEGGAEIAAVLRLLAGCDPAAVRALITDALGYVEVAPDPKHPGMFRALRDDDIKEMATLGEVLNAFVRTNVMPDY